MPRISQLPTWTPLSTEVLPYSTASTSKKATFASLPISDATQTALNAKWTGTVTNVAAITLWTSGTDLSSTVATWTTTPVITLQVPTASSTNRGALSAADWSTFNGKQSTITNPVTGTGTTDELAYWTWTSAIGTLPVATYPSKTELSYVKGVTSGIQSQINAKWAGTVTAVSVATANGVSGSSSWGATPALTIALGDITPSKVNGNTITTGTGTITITGTKTLTVSDTASVSGTNTGDNTVATALTGTPSITVNTVTTTWNIELWHAYDTTLARVSAWLVSIEWVNVMTVGSTDTVTGTKTMSNITLPTNWQIKLTVPTSDWHATGNTTASFVSGYTTSAIGDLVYLDSNAKWQKCDANTVALYNGLLGIALAVAATDAALLVALPWSFVYATAFPALTVGSPLYMSETAGVITHTAPTTTDSATRVIWHAIHWDKIFFNPDNVYITHT